MHLFSRCGSIHPGDQLLAIDNIPLDTCTVEEAVRLLQRSTDIVKLRVRKSSAFLSEEAEPSAQTIVYSVELSRRGGPLGITIASTDERGDPVVISQLAPGGLAERSVCARSQNLHISNQISSGLLCPVLKVRHRGKFVFTDTILSPFTISFYSLRIAVN